MPRMAVIAIDLGGTKIAGGLFETDGRILARRVRKLEGRAGEQVQALLHAMILELLSAARDRGRTVTRTGISVPGIADRAGRVWAPNIPGWEWFPLKQRLRRSRTLAHLPVFLESDRTCYILGEAWKGAARDCANAIFISVGTGVAAGILVDGRVLRGADGIAGSIGWLGLDRPFRNQYVGCGCFEWHASGAGLVKVARRAGVGGARRSGMPDGRRNRCADTAEVFAALNRGDKAAARVIAAAVEFWGMALANLVTIFNPEKVVFGGGVFGPARALLPAIAAEARRWAQPVAMKRVRLGVSALRGNAGLIGAACLAVRGGRID